MINWAIYLVMLVMCIRGAVAREEWTVLAAAFFIPMTQALPFPLGVLGASANIIVLSLLVAWLRVQGKRPEQPKAPLRGLVVLMGLFIVIGFLHRVHLEVNLGETYINLLEDVTGETKEWLMAFVTYFLVFRLVNSRAMLEKVWWAVLLSAGGEATLAVYERLQGIGRATGHLDEPNRAGGYFAASAALFLSMALLTRGRVRLIAAGGCLMTIGAVFATLSRGAMLATAVSSLLILVIFYVFVRHGTSKAGVAVLLVVVGVNASLLVPARVRNRVLHTIGAAEAPRETVREGEFDQSAEERLAIWRVAIQTMRTRPLGIGFYTFSTEVGRHLEFRKVAHNVYLQVAVELGLPALVTLILLVLVVWRRNWQGFRQAPDPLQGMVSLGLLGAWTAMAVAVFFINPFFAFNFSGQYWTLLAARMKIAALGGQDEETP